MDKKQDEIVDISSSENSQISDATDGLENSEPSGNKSWKVWLLALVVFAVVGGFIYLDKSLNTAEVQKAADKYQVSEVNTPEESSICGKSAVADLDCKESKTATKGVACGPKKTGVVCGPDRAPGEPAPVYKFKRGPVVKDFASVPFESLSDSKLKDCKVGDIVQFGSYYQSNSKTKDPIEWKVLAKEGDKVYLFSVRGLDNEPYHSQLAWITWEECALRKWLNEDFYNSAFSSDEKKQIVKTHLINESTKNPWHEAPGGKETDDYVFLPSTKDVRKYLPTDNDRLFKPTEYAKSRSAYCNDKGYGWWWMRSPGGDEDDAQSINDKGNIISNVVHASGAMIMPVMWVKIK